MCIARVVACVSALAGCATARGVVFVDLNRDGVRQSDEPGAANVVVALDHRVFTTTNRDGAFTFVAPTPAAHVWARVPDGFRPGPVFAEAGDYAVLALRPLTEAELASPVTFVIGADTHATTSTGVWNGGDLEAAFRQAVALPDPPRFFTVVGDVTQSNKPDEFERVDEALRAIDVPWVPVPGNHDWYDGGGTWRSHWGPDNYSFDIGGVHFVVWDTNLSVEDQRGFFERDLALVEPEAIVVALGHDSPMDPLADELAALGVDYLFTGHWHSNRRVERRGMIEWGTQTMIMGTIDQSPSGYRIVTFLDGVPHVEHRARLVEPHLAVTSPHAGSCAPAQPELLVAAAIEAGAPRVTARLDCGPSFELAARGGWTFGASLPPLAAGAHSIETTAITPSGRAITQRSAFDVCAVPRTGERSDWAQIGGGPQHGNAATRAVAPPLQQAWATSIGGHVLLGSPLIAGDTVVVASWDLGAGDGGGVIALDLATGVERWRYATPLQARASPAIDGDVVVIPLATGELHAVSLTDGRLLWTHDAAHGLETRAASLWSSPAIADGLVYVAVAWRMTALHLDGTLAWERDLPIPEYPWLGSLAAVTVADGLAIANYERGNGMSAWSATGERRWHLGGAKTIAVNATPVAHDGVLYFANAAGVTTAIELATSRERWSVPLIPESHDWEYSITATPALANGTLFVPTQHRDLVALDAATGAERWRISTDGGPLNFAHYRAGEPGFAASAVVTGDIVWVPRPDGILAAHAAADGRELWSTQLGAPIVSAAAPTGDSLVVATFDGTVRALVPAPAITPAVPLECPPETPIEESGCGCGAGSAESPLALLLWIASRAFRRRRMVIAASS